MQLEYSLTSGDSVQSHTASASGFVDVPNYGAMSLRASALLSQSTDGDSFGSQTGLTVRIDQRGMPLNGGWMANHSVGAINTLAPPLARGLANNFVPVSPIAGIAGQWGLADTIELNAYTGKSGHFTGFDSNSFDSTSGARLASVGGQFRLSGQAGTLSRTDIALQVVDARGAFNDGTTDERHGRSFWSSASWEGAAPWGNGIAKGDAFTPLYARIGGMRVQAHWLQSGDKANGSTFGNLIEAAWRTQLLKNTAGTYFLQPNLRWGTTAVANDLRGAYWRAETSTSRWRLGWNSELSTSVSGHDSASQFASVFGQYRLDTRNTLGATLSLRNGNGDAQSLQFSLDRMSTWGQTQWRLDTLHGAGSRTTFAGVDHSWPVSSTTAVSSSLGWQQTSGKVPGWSGLSWGVLSTVSPTSSSSISASLRGTTGKSASSLIADVYGQWNLGRGWSLVARYAATRGESRQEPQLVSALTAATQQASTSVSRSRFVQVLLRFEGHAGSASAPLGGYTGSGAGQINGTVYFDSNDNARRDASEGGAANVVVILDGRFVARTDGQGRYSFGSVVAGSHTIQVQSDNVPLPWTPAVSEPVKVHVEVRDTTVEDLALRSSR